MDYKELLNRCRTKPGWLGTWEQKKVDAQQKYMSWVRKLDGKLPSDEKKVKEPDFWSGSF